MIPLNMSKRKLLRMVPSPNGSNIRKKPLPLGERLSVFVRRVQARTYLSIDHVVVDESYL